MDSNKLEVKSDNRGSLVEAFRLPTDGQVFYVKIKPGHSRGDHYHERKVEKFLVIDGSATMIVEDKMIELNADDPTAITVFPPNNHKIHSEKGCIVLVWVSEIFNEKDPDTYTL